MSTTLNESAMIETLATFNGFTIEKNLQGITHEESLRQPPGGGNCLNWVLGHIVAARHAGLRLLGVEGVWSAAEIEQYQRGSQPVIGPDGARNWEDLRTADQRTRALLAGALKAATPEQLAVELEDKRFGATVGENLLTLQWHEGYHVGQLGVLRRLAGKEGAIR